MPVAQPFKALGRGNGFPFCISLAINVLDRGDGQPYDYWTTLGGFNKNSGGMPSQEQLSLSFRNAMKLCWNLYALHGIARGDGGGYPSHSVNQVGFGAYTSSNYLSSSVMDADGEPGVRVCLSNDEFARIRNLHFVTVGNSRLEIFFHVYRMYRGDTTDEDNFIGYGFGGFRGRGRTYGTTSTVVLHSAIEEALTLDGWDYAYTTISGIPFVCNAQAFYDARGEHNTGSEMADAAARWATASHENSHDGIPPNDSEVQLNSLDFFTY